MPRPEGRRHIVPAGVAGSWTGQAGKLAMFWDGSWVYLTPLAGWQAYVKDENIHVTYQSGSWEPTGEVANRLSVSADNTLLTHDGNDHRLKVNKAAANDTASLLFQSNFTGLAEMGAIENEAFSIRVSGNGSTWNTALSVNGTTAMPAMPKGLNVSGALTGTGVVGPVAQAGGVSTGAIVERGSTTDGYYTTAGRMALKYAGIIISKFRPPTAAL